MVWLAVRRGAAKQIPARIAEGCRGAEGQCQRCSSLACLHDELTTVGKPFSCLTSNVKSSDHHYRYLITTMSELLALRKAAAKRQAKKRARKSNDAEGLNPQEPAAAAVKAKSKSKSKSKGKGKTVAGPTRRLAASQLKWKPVNTSTVSAMDGGGGMLMLEELEGVGVEWVEEGGGRRATFVVSTSLEGHMERNLMGM